MNCLQVDRFLKGIIGEPNLDVAEELLKHAARCEACGARLGESPEKVMQLMRLLELREDSEKSTKANAALQDRRDAAIVAAQQEYLIFARAASRYLDENLRLDLRRQLSHAQIDEAFSHLSRTDLEDPIVANLAIAQLDTGLEMSALIGAGTGRLRRDGSFAYDDTTVHPEHFARVIHESIGISHPGVWGALVQCAFDGKVGVPDFECSYGPDLLELAAPSIQPAEFIVRPVRPI